MTTELIVNVGPGQTRVAFLEQGAVVEVHHESEGAAGVNGRIYKGVVRRVLPGMQAAFVDVGLERAAFLYVDDVGAAAEALDDAESGLDAGYDGLPALRVADDEPLEGDEDRPRPQERVPIERQLRVGQEVVVQIVKAPIGTKGARVTTRLTLPGRMLVLMPHADHIGISRRIEAPEERARLRDILAELRPPGVGFIVRTAAEGADTDSVRSDIEVLIALWNDLVAKKDKARAPSLLFADLDLSLRAIRDTLTEQVGRVVVDDVDEHERLRAFAARVMPSLADRVELYDGPAPIFDAFGVEDELARALSPKVWLRSGGYLVIEETEALTSIDVNTGRYVSGRNLEETLVKTNLEAVKEVAYQLRFRDIGGIIVVDFIDMERPEHRQRVVQALTEALRRDRARTVVHPMSALGLVELTRKRVRKSLLRRLTEPCRQCEGRGYLKAVEEVGREVLREVVRVGREVRTDSLGIHVHPVVSEWLFGEGRAALDAAERIVGRHTVTLPVSSYGEGEYDVIGVDTGLGLAAEVASLALRRGPPGAA